MTAGSTLYYLVKRKESIHLHQDLDVNIHSDFIYNSLQLETTRMSKNGKRSKQIAIYLCDTTGSNTQK